MGQNLVRNNLGFAFPEADDAAAAISSAAPLWLHFDVSAAETRP